MMIATAAANTLASRGSAAKTQRLLGMTVPSLNMNETGPVTL